MQVYTATQNRVRALPRRARPALFPLAVAKDLEDRRRSNATTAAVVRSTTLRGTAEWMIVTTDHQRFYRIASFIFAVLVCIAHWVGVLCSCPFQVLSATKTFSWPTLHYDAAQ